MVKHFQKQELTINRGSEQAMRFYTETVLPYIEKISAKGEQTESTVFLHNAKGEKAIAVAIFDRDVDASVNTEIGEDTIHITLEEDWTRVFEGKIFHDDVDEFPEGIEPVGTGEVVDIFDESSEENNCFTDYKLLENEYVKNENELGDDCRLMIVRGFGFASGEDAFVQVWDSKNHNKLIKAVICGDEEDPFIGYHMDMGKAVSLGELPDRKWYGIKPLIEMQRLNGYTDKPDPIKEAFLKEYGLKELTSEYGRQFIEYQRENESKYYDDNDKYDPNDHYQFAEPVSEELAAKYKETPAYVKAAEKRLGVRIGIEICDDSPNNQTELWCDTLFVSDAPQNVGTEQLKEFLAALDELAASIVKDNNELLAKVGESFEIEPRIVALFYTKQYDILEAYYDYDEHRLMFNLYENGTNG